MCDLVSQSIHPHLRQRSDMVAHPPRTAIELQRSTSHELRVQVTASATQRGRQSAYQGGQQGNARGKKQNRHVQPDDRFAAHALPGLLMNRDIHGLHGYLCQQASRCARAQRQNQTLQQKRAHQLPT